MKILSVSSQNFMSSGQLPIKIDLSRTNGITLISGKNGAGKSSITADALSFVFFNKTIRKVPKALWVNDINNKNCCVTAHLLDDHNNEYMIKRGLKPNFLEIYINGKLKDQSAAKEDDQKFIEHNILGMNFNTFTKSVIISKTLYTPFMKLSASDRREFVESILNLTVFGDMLKIQSRKVIDLKKEETSISSLVRINNAKGQEKQSSITRIKNIQQEVLKSQSEQLEQEIEDVDTRKQQVTFEYTVLKSQLLEVDSTCNDKLNKFKVNQSRLSDEITKLKNSLLSLQESSQICNQCGNEYSKDHKQSHIDTITNDIDSKSKLLDSVNAAIEKQIEKVNQYNKDFEFNNSINVQLLALKSEAHSLLAREKDLKSKTIDTSTYDIEINAIQKELNDLNIELNEQISKLEAIKEEIDINDIVHELLKDGGIKTTIISKTIPLINKIINTYLQKFGFFIHFELDSEFNEYIRVRGNDKLIYESFSEGEKLRIDMALLLAWREVAMLQNSAVCNLLFLDELTDSSLDLDGAEFLGKALNDLPNTNTFIITHTPEKMATIARSELVFEKFEQFTRIKPTN